VLAASAFAWNAPAFAQFVPAPNVPGTVTNSGQSIEERLYSRVSPPGIFSREQDHTPVQMGTSGGGSAPPPAAMWPATGQIPSASASPSSGRAATGAPGTGDALLAPQGLYTAPAERDPLSRFAP
jgi:hypothetical protein